MITALKSSFKFLLANEKAMFWSLLVFRSSINLLDVIAVVGIGYVATSIASALSPGYEPQHAFNLGPISVPFATLTTLPTVTLAIFFLFTLKSIFSATSTSIMATNIARIEGRATETALSRACAPENYLNSNRSNEDINLAVQTGASAAFAGLINNFAILVSESVLFIALGVSFFVINPLATLGLLSYLLFLGALTNLLVGKKLSKVAKSVTSNAVLSSKNLYDLFSAYREIYISGNLPNFINRVVNPRKRLAANLGTQVYLSGLPRHLIESGLILGVLLLSLALSGEADIPKAAATLGIFLSGGLRFVAAMLPWQMALTNIRLQVPQSEEIHNLLNLKSVEIQVSEPVSDFESKARVKDTHAPSIELKSLNFRYPDSNTTILKNVDLSIGSGQSVGLIGRSGSGKSTLVDIILGLIDPTGGDVLINGLAPKAYLRKHKGQLAYLPQSPGLISGTIRENVSLDNYSDQAKDDQILNLLRLCHLGEFLDSLPHGLNTEIGAHRDSLSGGQIQRLGLARALYSNPSLLILDEGTSALDRESEAAIAEVLGNLRGKVTVIQITHKLSTLSSVDAVFKLDHGTLQSIPGLG